MGLRLCCIQSSYVKMRGDIFRLLQAAATVYSSLAGRGGGGGGGGGGWCIRSGTFPLPEGLAPQTIGCYRLGFVVL